LLKGSFTTIVIVQDALEAYNFKRKIKLWQKEIGKGNKGKAIMK